MYPGLTMQGRPTNERQMPRRSSFANFGGGLPSKERSSFAGLAPRRQAPSEFDPAELEEMMMQGMPPRLRASLIGPGGGGNLYGGGGGAPGGGYFANLPKAPTSSPKGNNPYGFVGGEFNYRKPPEPVAPPVAAPRAPASSYKRKVADNWNHGGYGSFKVGINPFGDPRQTGRDKNGNARSGNWLWR